MPAGTKVAKCVEKVKASGKKVNAYAVCQAATHQSYATGKKLDDKQASGKQPGHLRHMKEHGLK